MASITPRKNKAGEIISYRIKVYRGRSSDGRQLKSYSTTYKIDPDKTEKQNQKALAKFALEFEERCKCGIVADDKQTFAAYAEYVISLKERSGLKKRTIEWYREKLQALIPHIGHMKVTDIRPQHLNNLYIELAKPQYRKTKATATAKKDLEELLRKKKLQKTELSRRCGVGVTTIRAAAQGKPIYLETAEKLSAALGVSVKTYFNITENKEPLSNTTLNGFHSFISTVFAQADREMLVLYNPASKATPPKPANRPANYFQIDEVSRIQESVEQLPIKWKTILHLLLITGARRGEIAALKWERVDWKNNTIYICRNLQYTPNSGVYETTTKTDAVRYIKLPAETMEILKQYRRWYLSQKLLYGDLWHDTDYLFFQEKNSSAVGKAINPTSITCFCDDFAKKNGLPHINPHAFRHTMASILFFNGSDSISISKRLGHSKVSTTTDIYSHIMQQADERSAECIADVILRPDKIKNA